jgi:hypothetical protein
MYITGRKYFLKKSKGQITLITRIFDTLDELIQVRECEGERLLCQSRRKFFS